MVRFIPKGDGTIPVDEESEQTDNIDVWLNGDKNGG